MLSVCYNKYNKRKEVVTMGHNKWMVACLGCLATSAVPGGLGMMLGVLACVACAGGCFAKWLVEEDKHQRVEYEKYLENLKKGA